MSHFDSIASSGGELESVAFGQFRNVLLLFSGVMLNVRSFFTISLFQASAFQVAEDLLHNQKFELKRYFKVELHPMLKN